VLAVRPDPLAAGGRNEVEIVNFLDDHSRLAVDSQVLSVATAPKVPEVFREAGARWGVPVGAAHRQRVRLHDLAPGRAQRDADPSCSRSGSTTATPAATTRRPVARWSGSIKRSSDGWPASHQPARSASSSTRWTGSSPTTATSGRTGPSGAGRRSSRSALEPRPALRTEDPGRSRGAGSQGSNR
jgi:hypothetical protein